MKQTSDRAANWQGMNWIRQEKRLAIYLRDGCACCYCGATAENGAKLTLDHLKPHSKGGTNHETNLVTCCLSCNSSRGTRAVATFVKAVAQYINHGIKAESIMTHIRACQRRSLKPFSAEAKQLMAQRGSAFAALNQKG